MTPVIGKIIELRLVLFSSVEHYFLYFASNTIIGLFAAALLIFDVANTSPSATRFPDSLISEDPDF